MECHGSPAATRCPESRRGPLENLVLPTTWNRDFGDQANLDLLVGVPDHAPEAPGPNLSTCCFPLGCGSMAFTS
jgi:hypothetical protein